MEATWWLQACLRWTIENCENCEIDSAFVCSFPSSLFIQFLLWTIENFILRIIINCFDSRASLALSSLELCFVVCSHLIYSRKQKKKISIHSLLPPPLHSNPSRIVYWTWFDSIHIIFTLIKSKQHTERVAHVIFRSKREDSLFSFSHFHTAKNKSAFIHIPSETELAKSVDVRQTAGTRTTSKQG